MQFELHGLDRLNKAACLDGGRELCSESGMLESRRRVMASLAPRSRAKNPKLVARPMAEP